ncbi:MAG: hypothetical protein BGO49_20165 [Planctomycetales bacterium 71-10]|nr:MAG: hypothetical protein BGO49_20165 [Planctomycetales bacterium 71-10]
MSTRPRKPLFERLKQGLEEGIAHAKGEITLRTVVMPEEPPEIDAETLVSLRDQSAMSQPVFARMLNVSTKTVQSWEQGVRTPSHASRRLIQIFSEHPETVCRSVGLPPVTLKGVRIENVSPGHRKIVIQDAPSIPKRRPKPTVKNARTKSKIPN